MDIREVKERFVTSVTGKPPTDRQVEESDLVRSYIVDAASAVNRTAPDGRYKSLALTALEEALMWANKGIFNS